MAKNGYKFPNTVISVQILHWKQVKNIVWVNSIITVQCWHSKMGYFLLFFLYYKFIKCQECNKNRQNVFSTTNYFAIVQRINVISSPGPSLGVRRLLSVFCKLFTFQASSPKPLGQLEPNLAGMFLGWSSTKLLFFVQHGCQGQ